MLPLSFHNLFSASFSPFKAYFIHWKLSELNGDLLLILILWGRQGIEIIYFICLEKLKLRKGWYLIRGFTLSGDREMPAFVALLRGPCYAFSSCDVQSIHLVSGHHDKTYLSHPYILGDDHSICMGRLASSTMRDEASKTLVVVKNSH